MENLFIHLSVSPLARILSCVIGCTFYTYVHAHPCRNIKKKRTQRSRRHVAQHNSIGGFNAERKSGGFFRPAVFSPFPFFSPSVFLSFRRPTGNLIVDLVTSSTRPDDLWAWSRDSAVLLIISPSLFARSTSRDLSAFHDWIILAEINLPYA